MVSLPCWELFDAQPAEYRDAVLPPDVTAPGGASNWASSRAGSKYLGRRGRFVGMCGFGASAPVGELMKHFGFTVEHVVAAAKEVLQG